jgi:hypothetical protein
MQDYTAYYDHLLRDFWKWCQVQFPELLQPNRRMCDVQAAFQLYKETLEKI